MLDGAIRIERSQVSRAVQLLDEQLSARPWGATPGATPHWCFFAYSYLSASIGLVRAALRAG